MKRINLNDNWSLKEAPLSYKKDMVGFVLSDNNGWYNDISLPADVHMPLIKAGMIKDPVVADYSFDSEWVEQRSWWFKNTFKMDEITYPYYRLVLESLDVHADIFLNGAYLGHHASAHFPFVGEVKKYLVQGENTLTVRLTSGLEYVNDEDLAEVNLKMGTDQGDNRGDNRRVFIRKPAYVYGWDWAPRAASIAIAKSVYIECSSGVTLTASSVETLKIGDPAKIRANIELEVLNPLETVEADVSVEIVLDGEILKTAKLKDKLLCSGVNFLTFDFDIENPQLWWPNGMGEHPLYEMCVSVNHSGKTVLYPASKFGIRTVELDISKTDDKNRRFAFVVNGVRIFSKGANWVPADSIYARITAEKYEALVKESAEANFNMLRIWGGGIYERDEFYDACDKYGILVWHDFMFACASFPSHREEFYNLVCKELDYQTKRLASRACIALFCGNNEIHCNPHIFGTYGLDIFNIAAPEYVRKNCNWIPYWNSSPYPKPSYPQVGDDHFWDYINMGMPVRIEPKGYDAVPDKFISEYGYVGPIVRDSIEEYFDGQPIEMYGKVWNHHNNICEKDTVKAGIEKHYTDKSLSLDEYLLYAGLVQSMMYNYSLESFRSKDCCGGSLIWMYSDCWGEIGWTVIDYYLRRKIAYYGVKRALSHVKLIMREQDGIIRVYGANDTAEPVSFNLKYGYTTFDGSVNDTKSAHIILKPRIRGEVLNFKKGDYDVTEGVYYAMPDSNVEPAILRLCDYKELKVCPAKPEVRSVRVDGNDKIVEITSKTYAHAVHLNVPSNYRLSDNYFDMLPGEIRFVRIENGAGLDVKIKTI